MKTTQMAFVALCMLVSMTMQAQQKEVELPPSMHSNTTSVEIHRVTLDDTSTVLDIDAFFHPGWWIKITSDSYLMADGKKYMIRSGEGIDLDSLFWMPATGEASFKLIFDPIPEDTKTFDFIEGDCADCFKIWGVDLINERVVLPDIPQQYLSEQQPDEDLVVKWEKGKAVVSGQLLGYSPRYGMNPRLIYLNPITRQENIVSVVPGEDGTFRTEIEMLSPANLYFTYEAPQTDRFGFIAAPGREINILINLPEANRTRTRLHKESPGYGKKMMFAGYLSKLNNDLSQGDFAGNLFTEDMMTTVAGMSLNEYYKYVMDKYNRSVAGNNAQNVSPLAKKIVNTQLAFEVNDLFMFAESFMIQAYMQHNKISWDEARKRVEPLKKEDNFNDYLVDISYPYNDHDLLLVPNISHYISSFGYLRSPEIDQFGFFRFLANSDKVKPEDQKILSDFLKHREVEDVKPDSAVLSVLTNYTDLEEKYMDESMGVIYLSKVWNTDDCLLFDLIKANKISQKMEDFNPLTDKQKGIIESFDPVMRDALLEANRILLAKIEENKKKTGYTVLDVPEVANEELFAEMIKPFKGKVVLVDIWETWCGPCREANKAMVPLKAQLADKEIVYLYLASNSSPENSWRNMIPDLHGYHYRVNDLQSAFLRDQLRSRGVPTYIVLDKEGNETFHAVGFPGADTMKKELMKVLGE